MIEKIFWKYKKLKNWWFYGFVLDLNYYYCDCFIWL